MEGVGSLRHKYPLLGKYFAFDMSDKIHIIVCEVPSLSY